MKYIYVDKEGYDQFEFELEKLRKSLKANAVQGSEAFRDAVGDGWHDNFAFEDSSRREKSIANSINSMIQESQKLKIVERQEYDQDVINIGDQLRISIEYFDGEVEVCDVLLTGKYIPNTESEIQEISLNSPLGNSIFLKKISDRIEYMTNDKLIKVDVLEKRKVKAIN